MQGDIKKSIMIGDSESDGGAANAAGIPFILLENGYTEKNVNEIPHDHLIRDFIGIEKIVNKYNAEDQKKLFVLKPLYQRALIVAAGPIANFILAIFIFFSIYTFVGKDFTPAVINEVQKESPAMTAGLKKNDIILSIDGHEVKSIMEV